MPSEVERRQNDITEAYRWVYKVTEECAALLGDTARLMRERGLEDEEGLRSYHGKKVPPDSWPYVYFLARAFLHPDEEGEGTAAFVSVSLGNERQGFAPRLCAGSMKWTGEGAQADHGPIYHGAIDAAYYKRFTVTGDGLFRSEPNGAGRQNHKGIEELKWFMTPLVWVSTPERLLRVVDAVVALRDGKEELARSLATEATLDSGTG